MGVAPPMCAWVFREGFAAWVSFFELQPLIWCLPAVRGAAFQQHVSGVW